MSYEDWEMEQMLYQDALERKRDTLIEFFSQNGGKAYKYAEFRLNGRGNSPYEDDYESPLLKQFEARTLLRRRDIPSDYVAAPSFDDDLDDEELDEFIDDVINLFMR